MALITCPECGQQISEHSDHCIHCGCKITVCHTCGKVFAGSGECPVCHAVPAETQKISQQNNRKNTMDLFDDWEHSLPPYDLKKQWQRCFRSRSSKLKIAKNIFGCLAGMGIVFLLYSVYILYLWEPASLDEVFEIERQASTAKVFIWLSAICLPISVIGAIFINGVGEWNYYKWLNEGQGAEARVKAMLSMAATKVDINSYSLLIRDLYRAKEKKYLMVCANILAGCLVIFLMLLLSDCINYAEMHFSLLFDDLTAVLAILVTARILQSEEPVGPAIDEVMTSFWGENFSMLVIAFVVLMVISLALFCLSGGKKKWLHRIAPDDCKRLGI